MIFQKGNGNSTRKLTPELIFNMDNKKKVELGKIEKY